MRVTRTMLVDAVRLVADLRYVYLDYNFESVPGVGDV